jgi:hypothetical protein
MIYKVKNDIPVFVNLYSNDVKYSLVDTSTLVLFNNNDLVEMNNIFTGVSLEFTSQATMYLEDLEFNPLNYILNKEGWLEICSNKINLIKQPMALPTFSATIDNTTIDFIPHYIIKT